MSLLKLLIGSVLIIGISSCMEMPEDEYGTDEEIDLTYDDGRHWGERYIEDACARCPECCVEITENGFIDEYGVERPLDWLPDTGGE